MQILNVPNPWSRGAVALSYTALLVVILIQPSGQPVLGPAAPPGPPSFERELLLTAGHILGFGLLTLIWWWALRPLTAHARRWSVLIALTLSLVTELAQTFVPDRNASWWDLAVNAAVTLLVAAAIGRYASTASSTNWTDSSNKS